MGETTLFTTSGAPNPRRVAVFLIEKGIEMPTRHVSLRDGEHFSKELSALNPDRALPFLVLPDGTVISESIAVCRFLDATHPDPPLFGHDARTRGLVEMWLRILEIQGYLPVQDAYRNSRPAFAGRALPGRSKGVEQIPALVDRGNHVYARTLSRLDEHLDGREFIVDDAVSMADIVAHTTLQFAQRTKMDVAQDLGDWPALREWSERMEARPSASAA